MALDDPYYTIIVESFYPENPVGTKFRIRVKLTDRQGGGEFLYNSWQWKYEVVTEQEFANLYPQGRKRAT